MSIFFMDSSALVKRYMPEKGTMWIRTLTSRQAAHDIIVAQITPVEMISAISRLYHDGQISLTVFQSFGRFVLHHVQNQYQVLSLPYRMRWYYKLFNFMNVIACVLMMLFNWLPH
jgi:uncharacterized protein